MNVLPRLLYAISQFNKFYLGFNGNVFKLLNSFPLNGLKCEIPQTNKTSLYFFSRPVSMATNRKYEK